MAKTLAMIKAHSASVKRRASMYSEIADTAGSNVSGISSLNRSPKTGKHMQKVGFIMMCHTRTDRGYMCYWSTDDSSWKVS